MPAADRPVDCEAAKSPRQSPSLEGQGGRGLLRRYAPRNDHDRMVAEQAEETMSETNRVALVTGAAGGIGRALVGGLLGAGVKGAAVDRTAEGLAELMTEAEQRQQGANLMTVEADLARDESIAEIVAQARARFGTIDILVNNAGIGQATVRTDNRS